MPDTSSRATWMALALGALEPGDAATLLQAAGPGAALRLSTLQTLAGIPAAETHLPPLAASLGPAPLLTRTDEITPTVELVKLGQRVRLTVRPPAPAETLRPLLLLETSLGVSRLLPTEGAPWPTLDRFLQEGEARVIDLVAGPPRGLQSLVLGLLSAEEVEESWPAGDQRDARIREAVRVGVLPGAAITFQVV